MFLSFGSCGCRASRYCGLLEFLGDSVLHAKFLVARHLQDDVPGLVQMPNDYLALILRILVHFDYILRQFVGWGDTFHNGIFLFWQACRNGLGRWFWGA